MNCDRSKNTCGYIKMRTILNSSLLLADSNKILKKVNGHILIRMNKSGLNEGKAIIKFNIYNLTLVS